MLSYHGIFAETVKLSVLVVSEKVCHKQMVQLLETPCKLAHISIASVIIVNDNLSEFCFDFANSTAVVTSTDLVVGRRKSGQSEMTRDDIESQSNRKNNDDHGEKKGRTRMVISGEKKYLKL